MLPYTYIDFSLTFQKLTMNSIEDWKCRSNQKYRWNASTCIRHVSLDCCYRLRRFEIKVLHRQLNACLAEPRKVE